MRKRSICVFMSLLLVSLLVFLLFPEGVNALILKSGFESKMSHLQRNLSSFVLPVMSVLGLIMAAILAAIGNESAKSKIWLCLIGSGIGFLAPYIIGWLQRILS